MLSLQYFIFKELTSLMNCLQAPHGEIKRSSRSLQKSQLRNITQHYLYFSQYIYSYIQNYLAIAMALKLLCPSDTALEIAVLSAHNPAVQHAFSTLQPVKHHHYMLKNHEKQTQNIATRQIHRQQFKGLGSVRFFLIDINTFIQTECI